MRAKSFFYFNSQLKFLFPPDTAEGLPLCSDIAATTHSLRCVATRIQPHRHSTSSTTARCAAVLRAHFGLKSRAHVRVSADCTPSLRAALLPYQTDDGPECTCRSCRDARQDGADRPSQRHSFRAHRGAGVAASEPYGPHDGADWQVPAGCFRARYCPFR